MYPLSRPSRPVSVPTSDIRYHFTGSLSLSPRFGLKPPTLFLLLSRYSLSDWSLDLLLGLTCHNPLRFLVTLVLFTTSFSCPTLTYCPVPLEPLSPKSSAPPAPLEVTFSDSSRPTSSPTDVPRHVCFIHRHSLLVLGTYAQSSELRSTVETGTNPHTGLASVKCRDPTTQEWSF